MTNKFLIARTLAAFGWVFVSGPPASTNFTAWRFAFQAFRLPFNAGR